jgi:hypothetical protein
MSIESRAPEDTIPDLTKEDFIVKHPDGGFKYPFETDRNIESPGIRRFLPDRYSPYKFKKTKKPGGDVFVEAGFDIQEIISGIKGPVLEVAGPTTKGFELLEDIRLPSRPLITNLYRNPGNPETTNKLDSLVLDALIDATNMPIKDKSVGVLLVSCFPWVKYGSQHGTSVASRREIGRRWKERVKTREDHQKEFEKNLGKLGVSGAAAISMDERIKFYAEARRIIEPGGLLIARGLDHIDLAILGEMGFMLKAHGDSSKKTTDKTEVYPDEWMFSVPIEVPVTTQVE